MNEKDKSLLKIKKRTPTEKAKELAHLPNPWHLDACKKGGRVFKNKKKYTRKEKYKNKNVDY